MATARGDERLTPLDATFLELEEARLGTVFFGLSGDASVSAGLDVVAEGIQVALVELAPRASVPVRSPA